MRTAFVLSFICLLSAATISAQTDQSVATSRENLLNGLKVIFAPRAGETQVVLKLRVDGGAAFDLAGKEGSMALLGDTLFPDAATRQLINEEFGGRLDVQTSYDALDVTLTGRAENFRTLFELLRSALLNPLPSQDVFTKLTEARRQKLLEQLNNPAYIADRAINARLYGNNYPYGRPVEGTPDSVARITRADLLQTRERIFNPNNTVLVIAGNFDEKYARAAVRQFLGVWRKSENGIVATFRQPELPNTQPLIVNLPNGDNTELRFAVRGLARNDKDRVASDVLVFFAQTYNYSPSTFKLGTSGSTKEFFDLTFKHDAHRLAGSFTLRAQASRVQATNIINFVHELTRHLLKAQTDEDLPYRLISAKRWRQSELAKLNDSSTLDGLAKILLNEATGEMSLADEYRAIDALTFADIQRVAKRLLQDFPQTSVAVGDAEPLKAAFNASGKINAEVTDTKSLIASLSPASAQTMANTNSNVRPFKSLSPTFTPPNKPANKQPFPLPKPTLMPTPTPSPLPTPPKQP